MGIYRRRVIVAAQDGAVVAGVEDDPHHYRLRLEHDEHKVLSLAGQALRVPYSTCGGALARLQELVGLPLSLSAGRTKGLEPQHQCTHLYELALIAIAQAVRGGNRQYDIAIPDRVGTTPFSFDNGKICPKTIDGRTRAQLWRDGVLLLDWRLDGEQITSSGKFEGQSLRTLNRWAMQQDIDDDGLEAIRVLRRAVHVSTGREVPVWRLPKAEDMSLVSLSACHVFQPERIGEGVRQMDTELDFTNTPNALLADLSSLDHNGIECDGSKRIS